MRKAKRINYAKWLIICFPYGLYLMWHRSCRWNVALKTAVSVVCACIVAAILIAPAPERSSGTQINIVATEPNALIFGPEAPAGYDMSDYVVAEGGLNLIAPEYVDTTIYVYASASEGSTYYHTKMCKYAYATSPRVSLYEAYTLGYTTPCGICNPPLYDPATDTVYDNPNTTGATAAQ